MGDIMDDWEEDRRKFGRAAVEEIPALPDPAWTRTERKRMVTIPDPRFGVLGYTCLIGSEWHAPEVAWATDLLSVADAPAFAEAVKTVARLIAAEHATLTKGAAKP